MRNRSPHAAWMQGLVLVAAATAIAVTLWVRIHRPFDAEMLAIRVGQLQSQAAEGGVLSGLSAADQLAPRFTRVHAEQLGDRVEDVAGKLHSKPVPQSLAGLHADAVRHGESLGHVLDAQQADPRHDRPAFDELARALETLHTLLKPDDQGQ